MVSLADLTVFDQDRGGAWAGSHREALAEAARAEQLAPCPCMLRGRERLLLLDPDYVGFPSLCLPQDLAPDCLLHFPWRLVQRSARVTAVRQWAAGYQAGFSTAQSQARDGFLEADEAVRERAAVAAMDAERLSAGRSAPSFDTMGEAELRQLAKELWAAAPLSDDDPPCPVCGEVAADCREGCEAVPVREVAVSSGRDLAGQDLGALMVRPPAFEVPDDRAGTVFDSGSETFAPIMAAIQAGEFGQAAGLLRALEDDAPAEAAVASIRVGGVTVEALVADDGAVVVQIDTPEGSDAHETTRVYMNEATVGSWKAAV